MDQLSRVTFNSIHPVGKCSLLCSHVGYNLDIIVKLIVS